MLQGVTQKAIAARSLQRVLPLPGKGRTATLRQDVLRRFASTPYTADLQLMGRTVRLQTNCQAVVEFARQIFQAHQQGRAGKSQFMWRIVSESDPQVDSTDVPLSAFSDPGLRYVNMGQRGFLAVDLDGREAVAFFSDRFVEKQSRFRHRPPLDILLSMTVSSLGLIALSGACVGVKDRAVLIFGPPDSGKTTASYLAAKRGLEFHADQVVFLDSDREARIWGDPFPAVFRPETVDFLPELRESAHHSTYGNLAFYYLDKAPLQPRPARSLAPVCSVFLSRGKDCETELKRISREEGIARLRGCMLFNEDPRFEAQINSTLEAVAEKPVYTLQYASDPGIAVSVIQELMR
jgi:hypothetical protein